MCFLQFHEEKKNRHGILHQLYHALVSKPMRRVPWGSTNKPGSDVYLAGWKILSD